MDMAHRIALRALLAGVSILAFSGQVAAQDADPADAAAQTQGPDAEAAPGEIIVTAQRRDQRLQDVPIAVSVVGEQALKDSNVTGLTDIQFLSPGVTFNTNFNASFLVRDVGTSSLLMTAEQSVGRSEEHTSELKSQM